MSDDNEELKGYFTVKQEKVLDLMQSTNQSYYIVADLLQENVTAFDVSEWEDQPVNGLMQYYMTLHNLRYMIQEIINNPPKDILKMAKKHNIKGFLIHGETLLKLNEALKQSEEAAKDLETEHKLFITLH